MTLVDANQEVGKSWPQILAILIACLASLTNGSLNAWSSPFIVKITKDKENYDISEDEASYFAFIPAISMTLTCLLFSKLNDFIGRKRTLILAAIPHILAWTLTAAATNVYVFYVARVLAGVGMACALCSIPMYVGEVSTPQVRGTWGNAITFSIYLGQLFINILGNYFSVRQTAYICVVLPIAFIALFSFMPESPYFYIMNGRFEDAKDSLRRLRGKKNIEEDFVSLKSDVERQISESGTWKDLFTIDSNKNALTAGVFLRISQQLGGMSVFAVYTQYIFEKAGGNLDSGSSAMIYTGLCLIVSVVAAFTMDKFGRRKSYIGSLFLCASLLFLEAVYFFIDQYHAELDLSSLNWMPVAGMFLYIICSSFGLAIIPTLMQGELFSASIKAKGITVASIVFAFFQFLSSNIFYLLTSHVGFYSPFLFFSICTFTSSVLSFYLVPETKGKTLEEIQQSLKER